MPIPKVHIRVQLICKAVGSIHFKTTVLNSLPRTIDLNRVRLARYMS